MFSLKISTTQGKELTSTEEQEKAAYRTESELIAKRYEVARTLSRPNFSNMEYFELKKLYETWRKLDKKLIDNKRNYSRMQFVEKRIQIEVNYPNIDEIQNAKKKYLLEKNWYNLTNSSKNSYLENIDRDQDIQNGWANVQWVYPIKWTKLVAVLQTAWEYELSLTMKKALQNIQLNSVPKIQEVFLHEEITYKIMDLCPWTQIDWLSAQEVQNIPQEHYNQYIHDIKILESQGIKIDPSKASNFFYSKNTWFHFIDLDIFDETPNRSMFDMESNFNAHWILDSKKLSTALLEIEKSSPKQFSI